MLADPGWLSAKEVDFNPSKQEIAGMKLFTMQCAVASEVTDLFAEKFSTYVDALDGKCLFPTIKQKKQLAFDGEKCMVMCLLRAVGLGCDAWPGGGQLLAHKDMSTDTHDDATWHSDSTTLLNL
jgi:hypothetical protein